MRRDGSPSTLRGLSLAADRCFQLSPSLIPSVALASFSASSSDGNGPISSSFFIKDNEHQNQASPFAIRLKLGPVDSTICSSAPGRMCAASSNFGAGMRQPNKAQCEPRDDLSALTVVPAGARTQRLVPERGGPKPSPRPGAPTVRSTRTTDCFWWRFCLPLAPQSYASSRSRLSYRAYFVFTAPANRAIAVMKDTPLKCMYYFAI
jgi:hypothetical protein